jgi:hypothetical protein
LSSTKLTLLQCAVSLLHAGPTLPPSLHDVFLRDFNLVYSIFTADVLWACFNAYSEHYALRFDLSSEAVSASPASQGGRGAGAARASAAGDVPGATDKGDLLGLLLGDAPVNFVSTSVEDTPSNTTEPNASESLLDNVYKDVVSNYMTLRFSRPQIMFCGPNTTLPVVLVAENMVLDVRNHRPARVQGRIKSKDSWTMVFKNAQYFAVSLEAGQPSWVPYECVEFQPDGCREVPPDNVRCLSPAHELRYVTVYHFINAAVKHDARSVADIVSGGDVSFDRRNAYAGLDLYIYQVDRLSLNVTSREWEAFQDVMFSVVLVASDKYRKTQLEIEDMVFRTQLTMQDGSSKETEVEALRAFICDLQRAVQDIRRSYDLSEQLLVTLGSKKRDQGTALVLDEHRQRLQGELVRNKKLFAAARHDLRVRVTALNEYLLNPVQDRKTLNRKWNSRYEVEFGGYELSMLDAEMAPICECQMAGILYVVPMVVLVMVVC